MSRLARDARGFTLTEILISLAIASVAIAGMVLAVPLGTSNVQDGKQRSTALFLAEQRLENVRNAGWTSTPANDCVGVSATSSSPPASASCNGVAVTTFPDETNVNGWGYARSVRVADCGTGCVSGPNAIVDSNARLVTVTVTFTPTTVAGGPAGQRTVSLPLLLAKR